MRLNARAEPKNIAENGIHGNIGKKAGHKTGEKRGKHFGDGLGDTISLRIDRRQSVVIRCLQCARAEIWETTKKKVG